MVLINQYVPLDVNQNYPDFALRSPSRMGFKSLIGYSRVQLSNQRQGFELHDQCHVFGGNFEKQMHKTEL